MVPTEVTREHQGVRVQYRDEAATMGWMSLWSLVGTVVTSLVCGGMALWPLVGLGIWTTLLFAAAWAFLPTYQRIDIDHETFTYTTGTRLGRRNIRRVPLRELRCFPVAYDGLERTPFAIFVLPSGEQVPVPTKKRAEAEALVEVVHLAVRHAELPRALGTPQEIPAALRHLGRETTKQG